MSRNDKPQRSSPLSILKSTTLPTPDSASREQDDLSANEQGSEQAIRQDSNTATQQNSESANVQESDSARKQGGNNATSLESEFAHSQSRTIAKQQMSKNAIQQSRINRGVSLPEWLFKEYKLDSVQLDMPMHHLMEEALIAYLPHVRDRIKARKHES